jgi:hypothetical protein
LLLLAISTGCGDISCDYFWLIACRTVSFVIGCTGITSRGPSIAEGDNTEPGCPDEVIDAAVPSPTLTMAISS